jgi:WD40 repeat protein
VDAMISFEYLNFDAKSMRGEILKVLFVNDYVTSILSPSNSDELIVGTKSGNLLIYNLEMGACVKKVTLAKTSCDGGITCLTFIHDTGQLLAGFKCGLIKTYSLKGDKCTGELKGHVGEINFLILSKSNANYLVSYSKDCVLKNWDIKKGICLMTFNKLTKWNIHLLIDFEDEESNYSKVELFENKNLTKTKISIQIVHENFIYTFEEA